MLCCSCYSSYISLGFYVVKIGNRNSRKVRSMFKVNNKDTKMKLSKLFWCLYY